MVRTVIHFTDSAGFGGAERALLHLLAGLDRQQWQPVLFHHDEPGIAPLLVEARSLDVPLRVVPRMTTLRDISRLRQFVSAIRQQRPAVFHAHLTWQLACKYGLLAANLAHVPAVVATQHLCPPLDDRYILRIQPRIIALGVDRYLAVSQGIAQQLYQEFRIPQHQVRVVYNGIPLDSNDHGTRFGRRFTDSQCAKRPVVLTIARLVEQKGLGYLLEAAVHVPDATFLLAGDGPERANLEALARKLGIQERVIFLGFREDIADLLANSDLMVLPSLHEGLPLAILEAMASGTPVIASAIPGNDEAIVHGETGLLVPPADALALTSAIRRILDDTPLAQRLAAAGRERAWQHFSVQAMVDGVTHLYDELLAPFGRRRALWIPPWGRRRDQRKFHAAWPARHRT